MVRIDPKLIGKEARKPEQAQSSYLEARDMSDYFTSPEAEEFIASLKVEPEPPRSVIEDKTNLPTVWYTPFIRFARNLFPFQ